MNSEYSRAVLELAVNIGETLLENGGEISRVQETMERVAKSYGCGQFHAYVLTNGIFASMDGREDGVLTARTNDNRLVRLTGGSDSQIGQFAEAEITGASTWSLLGRL